MDRERRGPKLNIDIGIEGSKLSYISRNDDRLGNSLIYIKATYCKSVV